MANETTQQTTSAYPKTGSILALVGGILIMLTGVLLVAVSAFVLPNLNLSTPAGLASASMPAFVSGVAGVMGTFGLVSGVMVLVSAVMLLANMGQRNVWDILVLVFSVLSFLGLEVSSSERFWGLWAAY